MVPGHTLRILLQGLTLSLLGPLSKAASLGLTVAVVPLESDGGRTVGHTNTHTTATFICPALHRFHSVHVCSFIYVFLNAYI